MQKKNTGSRKQIKFLLLGIIFDNIISQDSGI